MEVSKTSAGLRVEKVFIVADAGLVINPDTARQNLEGGTVFALSQAMFEKNTLAGGAPEQKNFDTYRLMRMSESPEIISEFIGDGDRPGGIGEIGNVTAGSALANALFQATGKRLRVQPFSESVEFA